MHDNKQHSKEPQKIVVIYDGDRPRYAAFIDATQEIKILKIMTEHKQLTQ